MWSQSITWVSPGKRTGARFSEEETPQFPPARRSFPRCVQPPEREAGVDERLRRSGTGTAGYLEPPILPSQDALRSPAPPQGLIVPGAQRADEKENT